MIRKGAQWFLILIRLFSETENCEARINWVKQESIDLMGHEINRKSPSLKSTEVPISDFDSLPSLRTKLNFSIEQKRTSFPSIILQIQ